jgi:hypothetical protein
MSACLVVSLKSLKEVRLDDYGVTIFNPVTKEAATIPYKDITGVITVFEQTQQIYPPMLIPAYRTIFIQHRNGTERYTFPNSDRPQHDAFLSELGTKIGKGKIKGTSIDELKEALKRRGISAPLK